MHQRVKRIELYRAAMRIDSISYGPSENDWWWFELLE